MPDSEKKGLWAPTRGYFQLGAAPAGAGTPSPRASSRAAEPEAPAEEAPADEPADVQERAAGAKVRLWAPTRGYFEHGGAPVTLAAGGPAAAVAKAAAPRAAAAAPKAAAGTPAAAKAAAAPAGAGAKAAARPAAPKAEKAPPPAPKKDPARDSVTTVPPLVETQVGRAFGERIYDEPDSETTLYKVPALNVAFAVSSALLLLYTLVVIYADYNRPWKTIQADWHGELEKEYETELQKVREEQARSLAALRPSLEEIVGRVGGQERLEAARAEAARLGVSGGEPASVGVLIGEAREALDEKAEYAQLREDARRKNIAYTLREKDLRAFKGDFQAEKYIYEERKRHALEVHGNTAAGEEEVRKIDAEFTKLFVKKLADLDREVEKLLADSKIADQKLEEYVEGESKIAAAAAPSPAAPSPAAEAGVAEGDPLLETLPAIEGRLEVIERDVSGQATKVASVEKDWRTFIRDFPGLDFLAPSYKIEKVVIADLHEDLNFQTVPRIDRCKTCHVNIDNPDPRVSGRTSEKWGSVYASHPRLDLFVGSESPHPYEAFGCTTCHYGDGHSTDFITASHTPQTKAQAEEWEKKYHWHRMHHQDYPMLEKKFISSSCRKCHPSDHKLDGGGNFNLGYEVVKTYGCYGCHKMKAFEGFEKVGPSLARIADKADIGFLAKWIRNPQHFRESTRMPRFFDLTNSRGRMTVMRGKENVEEDLDFETRNGVEALAIATYLHSTSERREGLRKVGVPGDADRGRELVRVSGCLGCHSIKSESLSSEGAPGNGAAPPPDVETLVRAGRSELAAFGKKADGALAEEVRKGIRVETRALRDGLASSSRLAREASARLDSMAAWFRSLGVGRNAEGLYHDLVSALDALDAETAKLPGGLAGPPSAAGRAAAAAIRDRWVENTFAPDLSAVGSKIKNPDWLADWIVDPRKHDPETVMPRLRLEEDPDGEQKIADMVAYLVTLRDPEFERSQYMTLPDPATPGLTPEDEEKLRVLDDLAFDYRRRDLRPDQTRDEALMDVQGMPLQAKLEFVGHRLIRRYGCFGCHMGIRDVDSRKEVEEGGEKRIVIGTFDRAQPIGTELEGWGIKEAAKLDYGHWGHQHSGREAIDHSRYAWARAKLTDTRRFDVLPDEKKISEDVYEYYPSNRLIQKTPEELLKMPLFPFVEDEALVDAAVNFLAGLVKDRIPLEKTHTHTEAEKALEEGSRLIAKLNCQGCHRIGAEPQFVHVSNLPRFSMSFNYDTSEESKRRDEFEKETWLSKPLTLKAQKLPFDPAAPGAVPGPPAEITFPKGSLLNRKVIDKDYPLSIVEAARGVVDTDSEMRFLGHFDIGKTPEGSRVLPVAGYQEGRIRMYFGRGPAERAQAPPPLVRQGERVRADWLFRFLLDVKPLRPWLRVRMPSFYLSQDEARTIVRWFRVNAGLPDPNEAFDADRFDHDVALQGSQLFGPAVGDRVGYQCNSCHPAGTSLPTVPVIRGGTAANAKFDYTKFPFPVPEDKHYVVWQEGNTYSHRPGFADREAAEAWARENLGAKPWAVGDPWDKVKWGPDLGLASERLRPTWLHDWVVEPQDFMPGTNMPAFFGGRDPVDGVVLKPGSQEKIDAIIRYLVHMKAIESASPPPAAEPRAGPGRAGGQ